MPLTASEVRYLIREGRSTNKAWHERSKKNRQFYDGDSISTADKQKLKKRKQKAVVINITKPACNLLIGLLACVPMDYDAKPMVEMAKEEAEEASIGLKQVSILNDLDSIRRQQGADAVIEGVGWVLSGAFVRDRDPETDPTQVTYIPARWGWYDLPATDPGLRNARYIGISRWMPIKEAAKEWPKYAEELKGLKGQTIPLEGNTTEIEQLYETGDPASMPMPYIWGRNEWNETDKANELNIHRDEVMIHELYYRDMEDAHFYRSADGHVHRYDPEDSIEKLFDPATTGFFSARSPVIRRACMAGPFLLEDESTGGNDYPIQPAFWDRDAQGAPYSFVQQVSDPQEEVNARRSRAWWEVAGQRVQLEDEWLDNHTDEDLIELLENVAKPDGAIKGSGVMPWPDKVSEHMAFVAMAKSEVTEAGAVTETMAGNEIGKSPRSAESKRQSTVQAGMGFEAHRQDFVLYFKFLGRRLLRLMIKHHPEPWPAIVANQQTGQNVLRMIKPGDVKYLIDIESGPSSETMRDKHVETILNLLAKLPPDAQLQGEAMLAALDAMDMPGVDSLEDALRSYLQRAAQAQQMQGPPPPKESVSITIPVDKLPPDVGMQIIQEYTGAKEQQAAAPASLEPAPQGAHRPRQDNIPQRTAAAMNPG